MCVSVSVCVCNGGQFHQRTLHISFHNEKEVEVKQVIHLGLKRRGTTIGGLQHHLLH